MTTFQFVWPRLNIVFSTDPSKKCAPTNHNIEIREIRLSAGAEFIVAIAGEIMTMPGLPKKTSCI